VSSKEKSHKVESKKEHNSKTQPATSVGAIASTATTTTSSEGMVDFNCHLNALIP